MAFAQLPLSIIVHTRNEAGQIGECLNGLREAAAEVILADMESTDGTVDAADGLYDMLLRLPLMAEFDAARNVSAEAATQPWILYLDADERLTAEVVATIRTLIATAPDEVCAFQIPFKVISFGGWIQHAGNWWPNYKSPPLLRKGKFRFSGRVHEPAMVDGQVMRVSPRNENDAILHFSHRDLAHYFDKLNRYTDLEVLRRGGAGSWEGAARGMGEVFAWYYDETQGKLDGLPGFLLAFGSAVYEAVAQLKALEQSGEASTPPSAERFFEMALEGARGASMKAIESQGFLSVAAKIETLVPGIVGTETAPRAAVVVHGQAFGLTWDQEHVTPTLEVAMVTHRGALDIMGGGEVQVFESIRALGAHGVRCTLGGGEIPHAGDLIHVFSLHHEGQIEALLRDARPYVLSPIYWDRGELAWIAPKIVAVASRAETLDELVAGLGALWQQSEDHRRAGRFVTVLPPGVQRLVLGASALLPNAEVEANCLRASCQGELPPVIVVPNGAPLTIETGEEPDLPAEPFVLCAGRVEVNKNQLALAAACRLLEVPLVLIGSTPDPSYAQLCRGIAGPFAHLLGPRSRGETLAAMGRAAVHALPSFAETPGLANLEAFSAGCPLVCSNRGAEREYFGEHAHYCEPLDVYSIAEAIQAAMATGRRDVAKQMPSWTDTARATVKAYRTVLNPGT